MCPVNKESADEVEAPKGGTCRATIEGETLVPSIMTLETCKKMTTTIHRCSISPPTLQDETGRIGGRDSLTMVIKAVKR